MLRRLASLRSHRAIASDVSASPSSLGARLAALVSRERITVTDPHWNRWKAVPGAFLIQLSIGGVYAWSIFNEPLTRNVGVVAASAQDWALGDVVPIFSCAAVSLGLCSALLGPWAERVGPRAVGLTATACWSSGLALAGLGCHLHVLPLLYMGYSLLGGAGWGLGYISPIPALLAWFPDKRGLASGIGLSAFGGGAMLAAPLESWLLRVHFEAPNYLGPVGALPLSTVDGRRFATLADGSVCEVIVAAAGDIARLPVLLAEGVYELGTGTTGAHLTFLTLAAGYLCTMAAGALLVRVPMRGWLPRGWTPPASGAGSATQRSVHHMTALRTPQFYLLWTTLFGNAIAGVTIISTAKTIMADVFTGSYPLLVTSAFAASYVMGLSAANMMGRLAFGSLSDRLGRKRTYALFGLSVPLALSLPLLTAHIDPASTLPLVLFCGATTVIVSFYGAVFAVLPAYVADTFGPAHVGTIFGRVLTGLPAAALVGPSLLAYLRARATDAAVADLAARVDPAAFERRFGASLDKLTDLVAVKSVTIPRLLELLPPGTLDPSSAIYNSTMYSMAGMLSVAFVTNLLIRPCHERYFEPITKVTKP